MDITDIEKMLDYEKSLIEKVYKKGLGVVFIGRSLGGGRLDRIYNILRDAGLIPKLPTRQSYKVPPIVDGTLRKATLSFPKWCAAYRFDLQKAAYAMTEGPLEATDAYSKEVLAAFKDDFRNIYETLHGSGSMFNMRFSEYKESERSHYNCMIEWNEEGRMYIASVPETLDIIAYGKDWDSAFTSLKQVFNIKRRVYKLEAMLEYGKDWKEKI